jgi:hypothetical protein
MRDKNMRRSAFVFALMLTTLIFLGGQYTSATEYNGVSIYEDLGFSVTSNNATSCKVTNLDIDNVVTTLNLQMTKNSNTYSILINKGNFTKIGDYCFSIECTDGSQTQTGSKCFNVNSSGRSGNSNIVFWIIILVAAYGITLVGILGKNEVITILGGMFMMGLSVYIANNGIIIYRDWITNYFAYVTLAFGFISAIFAGISLSED